MKCDVTKTKDGAIIVCSRPEKPKCECGRPGIIHCVYPVVNVPGEYRVCGKFLCSRHGFKKGSADYCKEHAEAKGMNTETNEVKASAKPAIDWNSQDAPRWIKTKYDGQCLACERELKIGDEILWRPGVRGVLCFECGREHTGEVDQI